MQMKVYAVRDIKAEAFGNLIMVPTRGLAQRAFVEAVHAPQSPMGEYPEDYMLFEVGSFDPNSGRLSGHSQPDLVMTATEAKNVRVKGDA